MSSCFSIKDAIPRSLLSNVIYEYKCLRLNSRYIVQPTDIGRKDWKSTCICHIGLQSFAPMLHAKGKCCIHNSSADFRIINHFKRSLNIKEDNAELALFTQ